jgi:hypothetical protein
MFFLFAACTERVRPIAVAMDLSDVHHDRNLRMLIQIIAESPPIWEVVSPAMRRLRACVRERSI